MDQWLVILIIAAAYSVFAIYINRTYGERKKLKKIQDDMKAFQKEYSEAMKKNDQAKIKELEVREKEFAGLMKDMLFLPFKAMIIILPAFLVLIWLVEGQFHGFTIQLPIALHLSEIFSLKILASSTYGVRGYFILSAAFVGIILEIVLSAIERIRKSQSSKPKPANPASQPTQATSQTNQ